MPTPRKKFIWLSLFSLICSIESITSARPIPQSKKAPATKQKRTSEATSKQKAAFWRWQNDPKIEGVERAARKALGWKIYGAVNCGRMSKWAYPEESDSVTAPDEDQTIIKRSV